jgi:hypothetical protein
VAHMASITNSISQPSFETSHIWIPLICAENGMLQRSPFWNPDLLGKVVCCGLVLAHQIL